jgi:hypothetical protein
MEDGSGIAPREKVFVQKRTAFLNDRAVTVIVAHFGTRRPPGAITGLSSA